MLRRFGPTSRIPRTALLATLLLVLTGAQSGCQGCWSIDDDHCGSSNWDCSHAVDVHGCADGDAILLATALYLALAVPYLIAEACHSCN